MRRTGFIISGYSHLEDRCHVVALVMPRLPLADDRERPRAWRS